MLGDFVWNGDRAIWALNCRITANVDPAGPIPRSTDWFLHVTDAYPYGEVVFYPAKAGGIVQTFHHQNHNGVGPKELPWRSGRLCVDTSMRTLGRRSYDIEPFEPESRLAWHIRRATEWLFLASRGELTQAGDPFELPHIPHSSGPKLAFGESRESFHCWRGKHPRCGTATVRRIRNDPTILVVDSFNIGRSGSKSAPVWGKPLGEVINPGVAWIWLDELPVVDPWAIPISWGEFRECCQAQDINLDHLLRSSFKVLRDSRDPLLLVGFPIPDRVSEPDVQAHWLALKLPPLTSRPTPGFRASEPGYWNRDRHNIIRDAETLHWVRTENWHQDEISDRGRLHPLCQSKSVLIVGCGAVGSVLAEMLVRLGIQKITIMDNDTLQAGNLVRHTLGVSNLGISKASSMQDRLEDAAVHSDVTSINDSFPPSKQEHIEILQDADIVIDCTANDSVVHQMSKFTWKRRVLFVSFSVGLKARRSFLYVAHGSVFPTEDFVTKLDPWLRSEINSYDEDLPRDGTGCWHALMPARVDDIWMMTGTAVKAIESRVVAPSRDATLIVFEQQYDQGTFVGLRRVYEPRAVG